MKKFVLYSLFIWASGFIHAQNPVSPVYARSNMVSQPGSEIHRALDNNVNTNYQTRNSQNGIPDVIDFYFANVQDVVKIEYVPRTSGTNGIWTKIDVEYSTQSAPDTFNTVQSGIILANNASVKTIDLSGQPLTNLRAVRIRVVAGVNNYSSAAEIKFYSTAAQNTNPITDCTIQTDEFNALTNAKYMPSGVSVNPPANSAAEGADKTIDNNPATIYYSGSTGNPFPVNLTYIFTGNNVINAVKYTPRTNGGNGDFGTGEVWYKQTSSSTAVKVADFNCNFSNQATLIPLSQTLTNVAEITVKVLSGENNVASCAEMEFFNNTQLSLNVYNNIFNSLHSDLKPGITQADINGISSPFFKGLAQCLYNNTYNKRFRTQNYVAYPVISSVTAQLKTMGANTCENPTGILFRSGTKAVIFVGAINGATIALQTLDFAGENNITKKTYNLSEGLNIIDITADGLGYIDYFNNASGLSPIAVNITTGMVNGYYDPLIDSDADWQKNLTNNIYKKYDVKGGYINLNLEKVGLQRQSYLSGQLLAANYDKIVKKEYELMGLFKYNKVPRNHMFLYTPVGGGLYANSFGAHMGIGNVNDLSDSFDGNALFSNIWGHAHELGHINQVRPAFKWHGMTEVTNNIYSAYCQYLYSTDFPGSTRFDKDVAGYAGYSPNVVGGTYNANINLGQIQGKNVYEIINSDDRPTTRIATIPFWQLMLYYGIGGAAKGRPSLEQRLAGIPASAGQPDTAFWLADLLEICRTANTSGVSDVQLLLNAVSNICDVVQEDLTDFFVKSGYLRPVDKVVYDYSNKTITITAQQIANTIAAIKNKNYPMPVSPVINYVSTNSIDFVRQQAALIGTAGVGVTLTPNADPNLVSLKVDAQQWKNVIAFETYHQNTIIDVAIFGTGYAALDFTKVNYQQNATSVYAVGYDGNRKLVYPADATLLADDHKIKNGDVIYPNPVTDVLHISNDDFSQFEIYDIAGRQIIKGSVKERKIALADLPEGNYTLVLKDKNSYRNFKFIKK
ncbi:M60 family metallopeptidase [Chryseobacterium populi]|uniref:Por secretion system C-terminal sorting domain containing protein n=1 Tax=Chryseobacterium populi TaxID=1144316 RepID=J3CM01_9FLAO|nr:M60 family metallopeptidase [Chryseobacterium populi]EJL74221.1 Por secretion system C-terminal sorting domain containing protein [Chryseobacterium populi]